MLTLNRKRPYGTVVGHAWASFEQDGVLFDNSGNAQESSALIERVSRRSKRDAPDLGLSNAKEFLANLLSGGPVDKSAVYRECENNNQDWDTVKRAFAAMGGSVLQKGASKLWKLTPDTVNNAGA